MVVGDVVHVGDHLERLIFLQLMERACSLRLDIGVEIYSVGVLQLKGAGWYSGDIQGILGAPNLRIDGCSNGGVVEEVSETFLRSSLLLPWHLDLSFLHARVIGIDVLPGVIDIAKR